MNLKFVMYITLDFDTSPVVKPHCQSGSVESRAGLFRYGYVCCGFQLYHTLKDLIWSYREFVIQLAITDNLSVSMEFLRCVIAERYCLHPFLAREKERQSDC
jgi:hypothetical protein